MVERVRRVVIGSSNSLSSAFTHVDELDPTTQPGGQVARWAVWGWDERAQLPHADPPVLPEIDRYPAPGGVRISAAQFDGDAGAAVLEVIEEAAARVPGFYHDTQRPGMHHTDTFDFAVVVEGNITVEAGDGSKVTIGPGDVYVCNGALHRWHYHAGERAFIVFVQVGAEPPAP